MPTSLLLLSIQVSAASNLVEELLVTFCGRGRGDQCSIWEEQQGCNGPTGLQKPPPRPPRAPKPCSAQRRANWRDGDLGQMIPEKKLLEEVMWKCAPENRAGLQQPEGCNFFKDGGARPESWQLIWRDAEENVGVGALPAARVGRVASGKGPPLSGPQVPHL